MEKRGLTFEVLHGLIVDEFNVGIPQGVLRDTMDYHGGLRLYGYMLAFGGSTLTDLENYSQKFQEPLDGVLDDLRKLERDGWVAISNDS